MSGRKGKEKPKGRQLGTWGTTPGGLLCLNDPERMTCAVRRTGSRLCLKLSQMTATVEDMVPFGINGGATDASGEVRWGGIVQEELLLE